MHKIHKKIDACVFPLV